MTQLTIKHLGRRIQYKPKLIYPHTGKIGTLSNIYNIGEGYDNDDIKLSIDFNDGEHIWMFKLILRSLSDLTKPITHKGETFVPIEVLFALEYPTHKTIKYYHIEVPNWVECSHINTVATTKLLLNEIDRNPNWMIEKLIEWQFVLDEPEGTWIDVNNLETNPYK